MEKPTSIYSKQHPKIRQIMEAAGTPRKVLCGAIDYAKAKHVVLFCNGFGDILRKPFAVENSRPGLENLLQELNRTCAHRAIDKQHVFFGGEDCPSYAENFIHHLAQNRFPVMRVNALEAKKQRDNHQASTDNLDLLGIAKALLQQATYSDEHRAKTIHALRELSRCRHYFVELATAHKLQMHDLANRLFPGFLNEACSGIGPFSQASLALMSQGLAPARIGRRRRDHLVSFLERHGQTAAEQSAEKLQHLAGQSLKPCPELVDCWQSCLGQFVAQYQTLSDSAKQLERQMALYLAKTSGAFLTSIDGIGIILAAGIVGEIGDPSQWRPVRSLCSYAGIVPRVEQTGGPDKQARTFKVQRRCNRRAKHWIVRAALKVGELGPLELRQQYEQLKNEGQHADFIMAKRLLRIAKDLLRRQAVYRPKALLASDTDQAELRSYYAQLWPRLLEKWRGLTEVAFAPENPLGQWRQMIQELYQLSLRLPQKRRSKAT